MKTVHRSVCPYDCPDACGLLVEVEDGRAVRVTGDPEHPVTRGLLCPKMLHYERTVHAPQRLTTPLLRSGPKGSGQFTPISWDEAVGRICAQWRILVADGEAESILPYSYAGTMGLVQRQAGHAFFAQLGASRLDRTLCSPAKDSGWSAVMGDTPAREPDEMLKSDLVILWGMNAVATSIHTQRDAQEARRRGARLWAIDTYRTPTCDAADEVFLVRPGGDGALALAMLHVLDREGMVDRRFVDAQVLGFDELRRQVLPGCSPEAMAPVCGLPAAVIERMARAYGSARAPWIALGRGLTRYGNGAMTARTVLCLPAATGAWQKTGGGAFLGTSTVAAFPVAEVVSREHLPPPPTRLVNANHLGDALTRLNPPVKSLYVYHSNPATVSPDQNRIVDGLRREDLFTVVHERFLTDTALWADVVLPATTSLEHADLYRSYGRYHTQRCDAVIPPVGEAKSNWDVFCLLAAGMGWNEPFYRRTSEQLVAGLLAAPSPWRDEKATEALRRGEPVLVTPPLSGRWATPSGKIEILNPREAEPLPRVLPTHADGDGLPLRFQSAVTPSALNSNFYEQEELRHRQRKMELMISSADAAARGLTDGQQVRARNARGEVEFTLAVTERVPPGTVVTEGLWWSSLLGGKPGVNALTSQRLTDAGRGSTFYDVAVEVVPVS